ncbi:MAG: hypothetical protein ACP5Q3_10360, partial [bacterium]
MHKYGVRFKMILALPILTAEVENMERLEVLKKSKFFASISEITRKEIGRLFTEEKFNRDDYIFFEGDRPEWLYIV